MISPYTINLTKLSDCRLYSDAEQLAIKKCCGIKTCHHV
jgi:hypothetical protein